MSGHLPNANDAGEAAIAVADALHAENPRLLKLMMLDQSTEGSNLPGWRKLFDGKAKECNGKWTEASRHLDQLSKGKVGAPEGNDNAVKEKNNAPGHGALNDDAVGANRCPKSERKRLERRIVRNIDDEVERTKNGVKLPDLERALQLMGTSATLSEVARIAGFKSSTSEKRFRIAAAATPAQHYEKALAFFGEEHIRQFVQIAQEQLK